MKNRIVALGSVVLLALVGAAAPAAASDNEDLCSNPTFEPACDLAKRQLAHVMEEVGYVPGYVAQAQQDVLELYDYATYTVRCVISGGC